jgi:guanylate kinase
LADFITSLDKCNLFNMQKSNKLIIITAPSGAGKSSITHYLLKKHPQLAFSVSATTRPKRPNEIDGVDYYFLSTEAFKKKIDELAFVEWEMVYEGKYYGTLKSELKRIWENEQTPLLDIEVRGAIHVQQLYPKETLAIFVLPPSVEELRRRLETRGTETADTLRDRINKAEYEISYSHQFNRIVVNDKLDQACKETEEIILDYLAT